MRSCIVTSYQFFQDLTAYFDESQLGNIIAMDMRKVNKFGKSCRLGVGLRQDFKCLIRLVKSNT